MGNVNLDVVVGPVTELPPPGTERTVESIAVRTGGAAAISALTMSGLGSAPTLVGCLGEDPAGEIIRREFAAGAVLCSLATVPGPTGVSVAMEGPGRDRAFLTYLGSLAHFDVSMIQERALDADLVLFCGYFLLPAMRGAATSHLLTDVRRRGGTTFFDPGADPGGWTDRTRREVGELLPLVDVLVPNADEAVVLTGERDVLTAGRTLQRLSGGTVIVKLGPDGSIAFGRDGSMAQTPARSVQVRDTTGAGDAFNGGLLHALADGEELLPASAFATRVASTVVSRPSTDRYPSPGEILP